MTRTPKVSATVAMGTVVRLFAGSPTVTGVGAVPVKPRSETTVIVDVSQLC